MKEKRVYSRYLPLRRREHALTVLNRLKGNEYLYRSCASLISFMKFRIEGRLRSIQRPFDSLSKICFLFFVMFYTGYMTLTTIDFDTLWKKLPKIDRKYLKIIDLEDNTVYTNFRFQSKNQLFSLKRCFKFHDMFRDPVTGKIFTGEEVLLCGLYRMHAPNTFNDDSWKVNFGFDHQTASLCFSLFCKFILRNWSYLIYDHWEFWLPYFKLLNEKIRMKATQLGCRFPKAHERNGMRIFGFIDNTIIQIARPGAGPLNDGPNSERKNPLKQRAWYNGWKKIHGIKFQTVDLANGMNANVFGPCSCRRNDLHVLEKSHLNEKLSNLQQHEIIPYKVYGDSAYALLNYQFIRARHQNEVNTPQEILENEVMSSLRESVEWNYSHLKGKWKFLTRKDLQITKHAVLPTAICAMIFRNAHVTLNGNITSSYYSCIPPSLSTWTSQGPRNVPLANFIRLE
jgi:hypothetical protein